MGAGTGLIVPETTSSTRARRGACSSGWGWPVLLPCRGGSDRHAACGAASARSDTASSGRARWPPRPAHRTRRRRRAGSPGPSARRSAMSSESRTLSSWDRSPFRLIAFGTCDVPADTRVLALSRVRHRGVCAVGLLVLQESLENADRGVERGAHGSPFRLAVPAAVFELLAEQPAHPSIPA